MQRVLLAKLAILHKLDASRGRFLIFGGIVVSVFAFSTSQLYLICHTDSSLLPKFVSHVFTCTQKKHIAADTFC